MEFGVSNVRSEEEEERIVIQQFMRELCRRDEEVNREKVIAMCLTLSITKSEYYDKRR